MNRAGLASGIDGVLPMVQLVYDGTLPGSGIEFLPGVEGKAPSVLLVIFLRLT